MDRSSDSIVGIWMGRCRISSLVSLQYIARYMISITSYQLNSFVLSLGVFLCEKLVLKLGWFCARL